MARKPDPRRLRRRRRPSAGRRPRARRWANLRSLWHALGHNWILRTGRMPPRLRPSRVAAGVALVVAGGLGLAFAAGRRVGPPASPDPTPPGLPILPAIPLEFADQPLEAYLRGSLPPERRDALLASPVLRDPEFTRRVHWWVRYWTGPARAWFPGFLTRMSELGTHVDSSLARAGFPPSLRYLPLIESGYAPGVRSGASAVGLWQLMSPTARELGLEVSPLLDERRDFERATDAALAYLDDLHEEFDSWFFALAAYNTGPTRVRRLLRREAAGVPPSDSLFWALRHHFASETRDFLPKLYGAMWVASRPGAYGYETLAPAPLAYDRVEVPHQTTLDVVARAAGVAHADVVALNPQLVRGITPADRVVHVRLPAGGRAAFARNYPMIPPEERVTFVEHLVRPGETLSKIAARYGLRTAEIAAANPGVQARALPVGARLTVPVAPSVREGQETS